MNSKTICFFVSCIILLSGCVGENTDIYCSKPYIRHSHSCCLDADENNICDWHEPQIKDTPNTRATPTTSKTKEFISTITTASTTTTTTTTTTTSTVSLPLARRLNHFKTTKDGDNIVFYFYLTDENNSEVAEAGTLHFSLYDSRKPIYRGVFNISEKDYRNTTIGLGLQRHLLFIGRIPIYEVNRSTAKTGRAELFFNLSDGSHFEAFDNEVTLPPLSADEYLDYAEAAYLRNATPINLEETKNSLRIKVIRAGYITLIDEKTGKDANTYFRVDLAIKNVGGSTRRLNTYNALLRIDSVDYMRSSASSISSKEIHPGSEIQENLLFSKVPDLRNKRFDLFIGSSIDKNSQRIEYWFRDLRI